MSERVEAMLLAAVAVGPWPVQDLRELIAQAQGGQRETNRAVTRLKNAGRLVRVHQNYWMSPQSESFTSDSPLYIEGHSREQLIERLALRERAAEARIDSTLELIQGDDAERLARENYGTHGD